MLDGDQVDAEVMAVPGGYYNPLDLQRKASNVDGTLTYELEIKMTRIYDGNYIYLIFLL